MRSNARRWSSRAIGTEASAFSASSRARRSDSSSSAGSSPTGRSGSLRRGSVRGGPVRLAGRQDSALAQPPPLGSAVRKRGARLRDRLHDGRDPRETGRPLPARPRLRVPGTSRHDRETHAGPRARSGLEAGASVLRTFAFEPPAGGVRRREARSRAHGRRSAGRGPHRREPDSALGLGRVPGRGDRRALSPVPFPGGLARPVHAVDASGGDRRGLARRRTCCRFPPRRRARCGTRRSALRRSRRSWRVWPPRRRSRPRSMERSSRCAFWSRSSALDGYDEDLLRAFFFGGRKETDTDAIKAHYKSSGFDPSAKIKPGLEAKLKRAPGLPGTRRSARLSGPRSPSSRPGRRRSPSRSWAGGRGRRKVVGIGIVHADPSSASGPSARSSFRSASTAWTSSRCSFCGFRRCSSTCVDRRARRRAVGPASDCGRSSGAARDREQRLQHREDREAARSASPAARPSPPRGDTSRTSSDGRSRA